MARITVSHRFGEAFDIQIRGCRLISDEPVTVGGEDEGPTPTELIVAVLAACAAEEGVNYLTRRGLPNDRFEVKADFAWDSRASRVDAVRITVERPPQLEEEDMRSLEAAVLDCPARKMLTEPPAVEYSFSDAAARA